MQLYHPDLPTDAQELRLATNFSFLVCLFVWRTEIPIDLPHRNDEDVDGGTGMELLTVSLPLSFTQRLGWRGNSTQVIYNNLEMIGCVRCQIKLPNNIKSHKVII